MLDDFPDFLPMIGSAVAEGLELVPLVDRQGDPPGGADVPRGEKLAGTGQNLLAGHDGVPVRFQIDLCRP